MPTRRQALQASAGFAALLLVRPARATSDEMAQAIRALTGSAPVSPGKISIDIPPLVENGNSVPVTLRVDSPMTAENYVTTIALFNEKNPQPNVAIFSLGPKSGQAIVSTRIRLATSQSLTAIARLSDGTFWSASTDVIVTIAACTES